MIDWNRQRILNKYNIFFDKYKYNFVHQDIFFGCIFSSRMVKFNRKEDVL